MSAQSKFYQVTGQILLEYKTDQYIITRNSTGTYQEYYMYEGVDGNQYCLTTDNITSALYQGSDKSTQYYSGKDSSIDISNTSSNEYYGGDMYIENTDNNVGTILFDKNGNTLRGDQIYNDTIRLYILTGYVMNNIAGYAIKVKGKVIKVSGTDNEGNTIVKRVDDYIYLLNWYMPKEELKDNIHWLANPLYLNSKFYDRYIEIKLPSAQDIAINNRDIKYLYPYEAEDGNIYYLQGNIDQFSNIIIDFSTISFDNIKYEDSNNSNGPSEFILDSAKSIAIFPESNANNFGIKLYEDVKTHSIIYYPTYGDYSNVEAIDLDIMSMINSGEIPLINYSQFDSANDGMNEFIEMYGGDIDNIPFKWIIINELSVTYKYDRIYKTDQSEITEESYTDYYTNTIDYTGKRREDGDFYISKFIPYIKERLNMTCISITIQYNCHLYNRMNNTDIVRSASMVIKDPYKYMLTQINTNNVFNYKIVNKIEKPEIVIGNSQAAQTNTKIIREFYDVTELVANDGSQNIYAQGRMTLYLNRTGSNYLIKLYKLNNDNSRVPYDLSGPYKYKLIFPSAAGNTISIYPNLDNDKTNFNNGSMSFYINKENSYAIMNVPASERYFSLVIDNSDRTTALYEGKVEWKA